MPQAVYLSGPMTGLPDYNYPAFNAAAERWRKSGWDVLNPAENFGGSQTEKRSAYLRADVDMLLKADAIALLDGWEKSRGAKLEMLIAQEFGLRVFRADSMGKFDPGDLSVVVDSPALRLLVPEANPYAQPQEPVTWMMDAMSASAAEMAVTDGEYEPESPLEEAQRLVHGDRGGAYGHPIDDYTRTGRMWGAILGLPDIDPRLCCLMMAAVKVSREVNKHKRDNLVDLAGYAECAHMVAERQAGRA